MGNGPGDLEDYFQVINSNDIICGGFVWEWCDHAIYKGMTKERKAIYYYGGDSGEEIHDGNFCTDGLVYPDRTPHTGLLECKNVNRPVRVAGFNSKTGILSLQSYMDFVNLEDYLYIRYELNCDGKVTESGQTAGFGKIPPHGGGKVHLKLNIPEKGKCYLKVYYYANNGAAMLGFDEILVKNKDGRNQEALKLLYKDGTGRGRLEVIENDRYLFIKNQSVNYVYNKLSGLFEEIIYNGKNIITRPFEINIWRAPVDNDIRIKEKWAAAHYDKTITRAYTTEYKADAGGITIHSTMSVAAVSVQKILDIDAIWKVQDTGVVSVVMEVKKDKEFPELPRFGLRLFLDKCMEDVFYYGIGPYESYIDKCRAGSHGLFSSKAESMYEDYIRPQENGSHADCDYVSVSGGGKSITAVSGKPFSINVSPYTQEELAAKKHNYELEKSGCIVLCLDYKQNGIGSNSCGPVLLDKYKFNEEVFTFKMKLVF